MKIDAQRAQEQGHPSRDPAGDMGHGGTVMSQTIESPAETRTPLPSADHPPLPFGEFVTLIAALMALTALGIDSMLPALPAIGAALDVAEPNSRQFVITSFLIGFSV